MEKKRTCYIFRCNKYPECEMAGGSCCAIEPEDYEAGIIDEKECGESLGYPLFREKRRKFACPEEQNE